MKWTTKPAGGTIKTCTPRLANHSAIKSTLFHRKAGSIRYSLAQGPDGPAFSPAGNLTWLPPKNAARGDVVTAVVTVALSTGTERLHTLRIRLD